MQCFFCRPEKEKEEDSDDDEVKLLQKIAKAEEEEKKTLKKLVLVTTLYDKVCQWPVIGRWVSVGTPISSTNNTDHHDIAEILLKVVLYTITLPYPLNKSEEFIDYEKKV